MENTPETHFWCETTEWVLNNTKSPSVLSSQIPDVFCFSF